MFSFMETKFDDMMVLTSEILLPLVNSNLIESAWIGEYIDSPVVCIYNPKEGAPEDSKRKKYNDYVKWIKENCYGECEDVLFLTIYMKDSGKLIYNLEDYVVHKEEK